MILAPPQLRGRDIDGYLLAGASDTNGYSVALPPDTDRYLSTNADDTNGYLFPLVRVSPERTLAKVK